MKTAKERTKLFEEISRYVPWLLFVWMPLNLPCFHPALKTAFDSSNYGLFFNHLAMRLLITQSF